VPPKSEKPSSTSYVAGCDVFARFLQGGSGGGVAAPKILPTEN